MHAVAGPSAVVDSSGFLRSPAGQQLWALEATARCSSRSDRTLTRCCRVLPLERLPSPGCGCSLGESAGPSSLGAAGWSGPGARAPGGLPHKAVVSLGKSAAAQRTGQRRVVPAPGRKPWSVSQVLWSSSGRHGLPLGRLPPPPLSPYEIRSPRRPMWSYTGFPPPLQVVVPRIRSHEAMSRSALLQVPNTVYPSTNRYPVATGLPR